MDHEVDTSFYANWDAVTAETVFEVSFDMMAACFDKHAVPQLLDFMTASQQWEAIDEANARILRGARIDDKDDKASAPDFSNLPEGKVQLDSRE